MNTLKLSLAALAVAALIIIALYAIYGALLGGI